MKNTKNAALQILEKLESKLNSFLQYSDQLSLEQLIKRQSKEAWSVLEIIEHLKVAETASLRYLKYKKEKETKFEKASIRNAINGWILVSFFKSPIKAKAPNVPGLNPIGKDLDYKTVKKEWQRSRQELRIFIHGLEEAEFKMAMYKHRIGKMTIGWMLAFFEVHMNRHFGQIDRILAEN